MKNSGHIYLIPNLLGGEDPNAVLPSYNLEVLQNINYFVVENVKNARRFLRKCGYQKDFDTEVTFYELNKHTAPHDVNQYLKPAKNGHSLGVISDAGCPGVADPGAQIVSLAQANNITVEPLIGPNSILLTLIGSGLNGQQFNFSGYLPRDRKLRVTSLLQFEKEVRKTAHTQLFMDTPYRNNAVLADLLQHLHPETLLCIGCNLTLASQWVKTKSVKEWQKQTPDLHKKPVMFALGKIR